MRTRARSALIMLPLLAIIFLGGYFLIAGVFVLSVFALREFGAAFGEKKPAMWVFFTSLCVLYGGYIALRSSSFLLFWVFLSLVLCFLAMFAMGKRDLFQGLATVIGVFYINFLAFHIVLVDEAFSNHAGHKLAEGFYVPGLHSFVWIVVLTAFGTDVCAYFTGMLLGKRKLCPSISPKKTIEGAIGGVCGSILLCGMFGYFFLTENLFDCIIIGALGSIAAQVGDLSASVMKRKIGIKDWGALIPGHGGILDRIDSMLFTAPLVFYYMTLKTEVVWLLGY